MSRTSICVRLAEFGDHGAISKLMQKYGLQTKPADEWRSLWEHNPEYVRYGGDWPIGWILEDSNHGPVGYLGNIPIAYEFCGRRLTAAATHAWVVDVAHRWSAVLLLQPYFSQKHVDLFVNASANYPAGKIFEAMHCRRTPSPRSDVALFWISDHQGFASGLLRHKGLPDARLLRYMTAGSLWIASQGASSWRLRRQDKGSAAAHIEQLVAFDDRFDHFWERLRSSPGSILCVRDRRTLAWHFSHALARQDAWIFVATHDSALCAYSIVLRQDNSALGLKRARLVDLQFLPGSESRLASLIAAVLTKCRAEGVHMLESVGFAGEARAHLESLAPFRRRLPAWMYYYKARDEALHKELATVTQWNVCSYDGDGSL